MKSFLKSILFVSFFLAFSKFSNALPWVLKFNPLQSESYVDCGTIDEYSLNEFTIETWLFVDNWSGNYIFANESWNSESGSNGFAFRLTSSGQIGFVWNGRCRRNVGVVCFCCNGNLSLFSG